MKGNPSAALPFSQACENNKDPILGHLQRLLEDRLEVLEIGSGTGQHASYFSAALPQLNWQPSDVPTNLPMLQPRCALYPGSNLRHPMALDVTDPTWSLAAHPDAIFTANSLHIMPYESVERLFDRLKALPGKDCLLLIYGPFNYDGQYSSESNARFDQWLAQQQSYSAIRDFEKVNALANAAGFALKEDNSMPANNRLLVWHRSEVQ